MKKETYLEQRNVLVTEAEDLINKGKFEDSTAKQNEIKALDAKFENVTRELANLNSLKEQGTVDLENKSVSVSGLSNVQPIEQNGELQNMSKQELLVNAFAKSVMGTKMSAVELSNVTYAEDSGVVIPETTMNEIIELVGEQYPFFGDAKKYNIRGIMHLPKHKAIKSGDAKGYKEKATTVVEENEMARVTLKGIEVSKLIEVSFKIEAMSIPAFMEYLKGELVDRIGAFVGQSVFIGDASTDEELEGVVKVLETAGQTVEYKGHIAYDTMTKAMAKLPAQFQNGAAVYVNNKTLWEELSTIQDTNKRPIFINDETVGGVGRVFGLPVKTDGGCPDGVIVIGKPSVGYAVNTQKPVSVETDKNLKARTTEFLGHTILDGKVTREDAFVALVPEA
ncbi:phage major capsid protein [Lysinibacillus sp. NPDC086135]|uniref:phage major capsid protein n=1 Tax=Lysinibacillus sp. NPDC086135 TaxID=3364130 RepID=UPI0037F39A66